jgi:hypothetical protein
MATIGTKNTLNDVAKRLDPNGKIDKIAEILGQTNGILDDMPWLEGNLPTGHKSTIRTGLPTATWRKLNYGAAESKSTTAAVTDTCGMLEAYSTVDKALANLNGNSAEFRMSEDRAFIEAMGQEMASTLFYGDTNLDPEKFHGLATRYNDYLSTATMAQIQYNVLTGAGAGSDNSSIWLIGWGENTIHGIYPKGSKAGLSMTDLGEQTVYDAASNPYQALRSHYKWDCGLVVRDWRYGVRIANIDNSDLTKNAATGADLLDLMTQALEKLPSMENCRPVFYANGVITSFLRRQQVAKVASSTLGMDDVGGKKVTSFCGVPVKRCDKLTSAEAVIS